MSVVLQSSGGGSITLLEPATASNRTLTLPDITGTVASTTYVDTAVAAAPAPAALSTASGSAPSYSARAWVNFNGTGTVAIRASGNVTSITDGGTGNYTVNFTTSMSDTNYVVVGTGSRTNDSNCTIMILDSGTPYTTGGITVRSGSPAQGTYFDSAHVNIAVFR